MRIVLACVLIVTGCAIAPRQAAVGGLPAEDTFESAFASVHSGRKTSARAEGWTLEWAGEHRLRILREEVTGLKQMPSDAELARELRAKLRRYEIQVKVEAGVVTLRGWVDSQWEAVAAVRAVMEKRGVVAVNAQLGYPVNQASRR